MSPKRKGAAAKNKKGAPPAKTTRGKKKIVSDGKTPVTPPDPSSDDSSDDELLFGDYSCYLASDELAQDADYIGMEFTPEDDEMFAKFHNPYSKEAQEEIKRWNQRSWFLNHNEKLLKLLDSPI